MAFLDKFNEWYAKVVPERGPGISVAWNEPVVGARYRWRQGRRNFFIIATGIFVILLLPIPSKNGSAAPFGARLLIASGMVGAGTLLGWALGNLPARIFLTAKRVRIGAGRGARYVSLDAARAVALEKRDGYVTLVVTDFNGDQQRIYLDPRFEHEVRDLLTRAGRLKDA